VKVCENAMQLEEQHEREIRDAKVRPSV